MHMYFTCAVQKCLPGGGGGGPALTTFFFSYQLTLQRGEEVWRVNGSPTLNAGRVVLQFPGVPSSISKGTYSFEIFQGWGFQTPSPPSGFANVLCDEGSAVTQW